MAALDTVHKAPLIVRTATGTLVGANNQTLTFDPEGIAQVEGAVDLAGEGTCWYIAGVAPGTTTITVEGAGSSATIEVTVTIAPLVVALGDPVAR